MNATQAIDSIVKLLGLSFKKESFKSVFLVDGTEVTNNADGDFEVGQTLYIVKESTLAPAPEGSHETREGLVLTVDSESTIIAIASKNTESTDVNSTPEKMTIAKDAQGQDLESPTFDVGEDVYVVAEDGSKTPAPDGEHQVVLKDSDGNKVKIRVMTKDGKIVERENVEEMEDMMSAEEVAELFSQALKKLESKIDAISAKQTELDGKFQKFSKEPAGQRVFTQKTINETFSETESRVESFKRLREALNKNTYTINYCNTNTNSNADANTNKHTNSNADANSV